MHENIAKHQFYKTPTTEQLNSLESTLQVAFIFMQSYASLM